MLQADRTFQTPGDASLRTVTTKTPPDTAQCLMRVGHLAGSPQATVRSPGAAASSPGEIMLEARVSFQQQMCLWRWR